MTNDKLAIALKHYQAGRLIEAEEIYRQIIQQQPNDAGGYNNLGNILIAQGKTEDAIASYQKAVSINPNHPQAHNNLGNIFLSQGKLEDAIACFQQALSLNPEYVEACYNLGNAFLAKGCLASALMQYQQAIALQPNFPEAYNNLAHVWQEQGKLEDAIACYQQAISLNPNYAQSYNNLGNIWQEQGKLEDAIACYQQAIKLNPNYPEAHNNLGNVYQEQWELEEAISCFQQAISLNSNYADAYNNLGNVLKYKGNWMEAAALYRQALTINPNFPEARENLGLIFLLTGNLRTGFAEYEWRCQTRKFLRRSFPYPVWDGSDLQGQKILLISDQGYGDAIQFIRYVSLIVELGGKVIVVCQEALVRLFTTVAGIEQVITEAVVEFDVHAPLMSLPYLMATTLDTIPAQIPYLAAPKPYPFQLETPPQTYLKVGIVWAGNPGNSNDRNRSCDVSYFSSILKISGIAFYSLQKGAKTTKLEGVEDLSDRLNDFASTAAAIEQLDLVITVDTSVAHLAGALGKPVWVVLSFIADWRWMLEREDSPWYPTMRLFRQSQPGDWTGVFARVSEALAKLVDGCDRHAHLAEERQPKKSSPSKISKSLEIALKHHQAGRLKKAEQIYREIIQKQPNCADAYNNLGNALADGGKLAEAIASYQQAVTLNPKYIEAHYNLANLYNVIDKLEEAIASYQQVICLNPDDANAYYNLGIALVRQGKLEEAIASYQKAIALNPKDAEAHNNLGNALQQQEKLEQAIAYYQKALTLNPNYVEAYNNLGYALQEQQKLEEAISCYQKAIALNPNNAEVYNNLGNAFEEQGKLEDAIAYYQQALALNPNYPNAYNNLGKLFIIQGKIAEAQSVLRQALTINPNFPEAHENLGVTLLYTGNLKNGFAETEWRWQIKEFIRLHLPQSLLWDGSDLQGRKILLVCEQGFGDSIQFIRYAPLVAQRGGRVIVMCYESQQRLFSTVPGIEQLVTMGTVVEFDFHAPLMSLPHILGTTLETIPAEIPYLSPPQPYPFTLKVPLGTLLKIGIVWAGDPANKNDRNRSCSLRHFLSFLNIPQIAFYSLQKGAKVAELSELGILERVEDLSDRLNDFASTAAAIEQLDLVITVDTSVAHLAGALGKPVWVLLSFIADWRWMLEREDSPWYPTMRLFRQSQPGDWRGVFARVSEALANLVDGCDRHAHLAAERQPKKSSPSKISKDLEIALKHHQAGRLKKAEQIYREIIQKQPNCADAYNNLGVVLQARGKLAQAKIHYQKAIAIAPQATDARTNLGVTLWKEGKLEEAIACYQKIIELNPQDANAYNTLADIYQERGNLEEAIACYQQAISLNPNYAEAYYSLGVALQFQDKFESALLNYQKALSLKPNFPEPYNTQGSILQEQGKLEEAIACYQKALALDANLFDVYNNLGFALQEQGKLEEAIACYQKALTLNPNYPEAYNNLGNVLQEQGKIKEGIACYQKAISLKANDPEFHKNLGMMLLLIGNLQTGFAEYEWRIQTKEFRTKEHFPCPIWDGSDLQGRTILLVCEQGFGDAIQFIRYVPILAQRGANIILICREPLQRLFSDVPGIQQIITTETVIKFQVYALLMSLPHFFGTTLETIPAQIPYLTAPQPYPFTLQPPPQTRLKIGIVWAGNPDNKNDRKRSCELSYFSTILNIPGIAFYSLQKGPNIADLTQLDNEEIIEDLSDRLNDFADTAAVIAQLDLVITVDTSVAHLAGALGKPVWVLLSFVPDWRWMLEREDSPWYPTMRLFRQSQMGDWSGVFQRVVIALTDLLTELQVNSPKASLADNKKRQEAEALALSHYQAGRLTEAEIIYREILIKEPQYADGCNNLGTVLMAQGNLPEAVSYYQQAIALNANNADAYYNLGIALYQQENLKEAIASFRQALAFNPNHVYAYNNVGNALLDKGSIEEAIASFQQALALNPNFVPALNNLGNCLKAKGNIKEAQLCYQQAIDLDPNNAEAHKNLGIILLLNGELKSGFSEYEWRWQTKEYNGRSLPSPLWDGADLQGRKILIACEQGFGDSIQFIRYVPLIVQRGGRVILFCYEELRRLFSSVAGIEELVTNDDFFEFECCVSLMSLPDILGTSLETIPAQVPYLTAPQPYPFQLEAPAETRLKVGIVWAGNPANQDDNKRSCDLRYFSSLLNIPGIAFYSLQKGMKNDTLEGVQDLSEQLNDFADTGAAIAQLDLVISVDTSVAHLAGALGKPVWVLLSFIPDWRWMLEREDSPWYPTMRLFRQSQPGDWSGVFERVAIALQNWLSELPESAEKEKNLLPPDGFNHLKKCRHGVLLYNRNDIYIGRSIELYGEYSQSEIDLFSQLIATNDLIVEVGANIGAHTVFFAKTVGAQGTVFAFEPQRIIFQTLCANIALNSITNTYCYNVALSDNFGSIEVPILDYNKSGNFGSVSLASHIKGELAQVITLDSLNLPFCRLIKIDVEGMELQVLQGAANTINRLKPILYVENDRSKNSDALIRYIDSLGYKMYWHIAPLYNPNNYFQNSENVFGTTLSLSMLCFHASYDITISGLPEVELPN